LRQAASAAAAASPAANAPSPAATKRTKAAAAKAEAAAAAAAEETEAAAAAAARAPRRERGVSGDDAGGRNEDAAYAEAGEEDEPLVPQLPARRKVPDLVGGWFVRGSGNSRKRGGVEDEEEGEGGAEEKAEKGAAQEAEEDMARYKPLEEAVSLVVVSARAQEAFASSARKKGARSGGGGGSSGAAAAAGGPPNFKKFRKNRVLYGPALGDFVQLVLVAAEENERVAQMRREEGEAEEYERQADALFADGDARRKHSSMAAPQNRARRR
jgi:hypothetical protein